MKTIEIMLDVENLPDATAIVTMSEDVVRLAGELALLLKFYKDTHLSAFAPTELFISWVNEDGNDLVLKSEIDEMHVSENGVSFGTEFITPNSTTAGFCTSPIPLEKLIELSK